MISKEKLAEIAGRLLERSRKNEVNWTQRPHSSRYAVIFPKSDFEIVYNSPDTEPDTIAIRVIDNNGQVVGHLEVDATSDGWSLLKELHDEADRCVTGWDVILDEIEKETGKDGRIGQGPQEPPPEPMAPGIDGIPF